MPGLNRIRNIIDLLTKRTVDISVNVGGGPTTVEESGAYQETLPASNPFPTQIIWWNSSSKTRKLSEILITRNANQSPTTIVWKTYEFNPESGNNEVNATVTDTITYDGVLELTRTRTIS